MSAKPIPRRGLPRSLLVAAAAGLVHAGFSAYWAAGGSWLLSTLGTRLVESFADVRWVLFVVAAVKVAAALVPLWLDVRGWPQARLWVPVCWLGSAVLIAWGGLNTVIGNAVLAGLIRPAGGYDRLGMVGHAFLWDPLFLVWGLALAVGLWRGVRPGAATVVD